MRPIGAGLFVTLAIVATAINLRPAIITIGPLLPAIAHSLALNTPAIATVSALPIVVLGLVSPFAYRLAAMVGLSGAMLAAQVATALGIALRSSGAEFGLIAGSVLLAAGIGLANTLLPALIKLRFPNAMGRLMGLYTMALTIGAAVGSALTPLLVPRFGGDWRGPLAVWALPAVVAALMWIPLARDATRARPGVGGVSPWRSRTGWFVTLFMGMQSMYFYSLVTWLGVLLQARGMTLVESGIQLSIFFLTQILSALLGPMLIVRVKSQGWYAAAFMFVTVLATSACLFVPLWAVWIAAVVDGVSLGALFGCALTFIVLRARDVATSARLSGMAQSVGYVMAAIGPFVLGFIHARPDALVGSTIWFCVMGAVAMTFAVLAGRERVVEDDVAVAA